MLRKPISQFLDSKYRNLLISQGSRSLDSDSFYLFSLLIFSSLQEYKNGQDLRALYLTGDNAIQGIDAQKAESVQLNVLADAGGEGGVIVDSANALLQGKSLVRSSSSPDFVLTSNLLLSHSQVCTPRLTNRFN